MAEVISLNRMTFEEELKKNLMFKLVFSGVVLTYVFYAAMIVVMFFFAGSEDESYEDMIPVCNIVRIIALVGGPLVFAVAEVVYHQIGKSKIIEKLGEPFEALTKLGGSSSEEANCLRRIAGGYFVYAFIVQLAALFSYVALLLPIIYSVIRDKPVYWVGGIPLILAVVIMIVRFPTNKRLTQIFEDRFLKAGLN